MIIGIKIKVFVLSTDGIIVDLLIEISFEKVSSVTYIFRYIDIRSYNI